jgi:hypothetical protein
MTTSHFKSAADALTFIGGGNATFTITSGRTAKHFTFKAKGIKDNPTGPIFVKVLNGPDNSWDGDWSFLGSLFADTEGKRIFHLVAGRKGNANAPSFKALSWLLGNLDRDVFPADVVIQHEGSCCRCGRKLTHPDSITSGVGPECKKHF